MPLNLPLLTFALITYNQEEFVEEALAGALAQTYPNLEILVSDDASTDRTFEVAEAYLAGHDTGKRVTLERRPRNLGLIGNVNYVLHRARGALVVIAAGDDISAPQRVERLYEAYASHAPAPRLLHSSAQTIGLLDEIMVPPLRQITDLEEICRCTAGYIGATGAFHPELWRFFGPIEMAGAYEDLVYAFRAALLGGIAYIDEPLVTYRIGAKTTVGGLRRGLRDHYALHRRFRTSTHAVYAQRLHDLRRFRQCRPAGGEPADDVLERCQRWLEEHLPAHAEWAAYHDHPGRYVLRATLTGQFDKLNMVLRENYCYWREYRRHRRQARS